MTLTRTFYILTPTKGEPYCDGEGGTYKRQIYYCQAWENGQLFKEWKNTQITTRYQASIYAILNIVIELVNENYKGEIIAYIPDELIVNEANGAEYYKNQPHSPRDISDLHPCEKGFKNSSREELEAVIKHAWQPQNIYGKYVKLTRWIYLGNAYKRAKENGIYLNIKLLAKENIKLTINTLAYLKPHNPPTHIIAKNN